MNTILKRKNNISYFGQIKALNIGEIYTTKGVLSSTFEEFLAV